jgi:hypothetical protein
MIKIFDNKISKEDQNTIYTFCKNKEYFRGENDRPNLPPTGLVSALDDESVINTLLAVTGNKNKKLFRSYINFFAPYENPFYHKDNEKVGYETLLYYVNTENINVDEGGETFFIEKENRIGIPYVAGRIIIFDANILHKASSFRNLDRFTIALKWEND